MKDFFKLFVSLISFIYTMNAQITEDTIVVSTGWNMIGSLNAGLASDIIRSEPPGIIASEYFTYTPGGGYEAKDTLKKGGGYWVKVNNDGLIIISVQDSAMEMPCPGIATVDYSGKTYNTIQIGSQCWLRENLDVGLRINGSQEQTDDSYIEKYCYDDNPAYCDTYGGLYQWNEAMKYTTTPGTRGICPTGWHIPTLVEFQTLSDAVGGDGNALKAIGEGIPPDGEGTNTSGFSALLVGYRGDGGTFSNLSVVASFWSSTVVNYSIAYFMGLYHSDSYIYSDNDSKGYGFSVRCLKD